MLREWDDDKGMGVQKYEKFARRHLWLVPGSFGPLGRRGPGRDASLQWALGVGEGEAEMESAYIR